MQFLNLESKPMATPSAIVSLIQNQAKDHMQMSNFQPLSILHNDYKVFGKVLGMHLEKAIPSLVHLDRVVLL